MSFNNKRKLIKEIKILTLQTFSPEYDIDNLFSKINIVVDILIISWNKLLLISLINYFSSLKVCRNFLL